MCFSSSVVVGVLVVFAFRLHIPSCSVADP